MKRTKLLSVLLVACMILSLCACGKKAEEAATSSDEPKASEEVKEPEVKAEEPAAVDVSTLPTSIDFEDGNLGFVQVASHLMEGDPSTISVADVNGSKALLTATVQKKKSVYVGFDIASLLGDKVADVAKITFDVTSVSAEGFNAISGAFYTFTGEDNATKTKETPWSVYLPSKVTKTIEAEITVPFTKGANNYFVISKEDDVATGDPTQIAIDNIRFIDAAGNVLTADTSVALAEASPLVPVVAAAAAGHTGYTYPMENVYGGDWGCSAIAPAAFFENVNSNMSVTVEFALEPGFDYYLAKPMTSWWTGLVDVEGAYADLVPADTGAFYHLQADGFMVIDDWGITEFSFALTPAGAAKLAEEGGLAFQVYGVTVKDVVFNYGTFETPMEGTNGGDWGCSAIVPAAFFEGADGNVAVHAEFALEPGYDYYLAKPMTSWWTGLIDVEGAYADLAAADSGVLYHLQSDGFMVIDDWGITGIDFTLTKEGAAKVAEEGGLAFQVYGVTFKSATVSHDRYTYAMENAYAGDWGSSAIAPAALFNGDNGNVGVDVEFALEPGFDYYLAKPMTSWWTGLVDVEGAYADLVAADTGVFYHLQADGFMVIDDWGITHMHFTLTPAGAAKVAEEGGLAFQVYGVTVKNVKVSYDNAKAPMEGTNGGDWGCSAIVPAAFFEGADGNVAVHAEFALEPGYDYYLAKPMTSWWTGLIDVEGAYADLAAADTGVLYHLQSDGFMVIDDWGITAIDFTLTPAGAARVAEEGGLAFQVYGVTFKEATVIK